MLIITDWSMLLWPRRSLASLTPRSLTCETGLVNLYKDIERPTFIKHFVNLKALGKSVLQDMLEPGGGNP